LLMNLQSRSTSTHHMVRSHGPSSSSNPDGDLPPTTSKQDPPQQCHPLRETSMLCKGLKRKPYRARGSPDRAYSSPPSPIPVGSGIARAPVAQRWPAAARKDASWPSLVAAASSIWALAVASRSRCRSTTIAVGLFYSPTSSATPPPPRHAPADTAKVAPPNLHSTAASPVRHCLRAKEGLPSAPPLPPPSAAEHNRRHRRRQRPERPDRVAAFVRVLGAPRASSCEAARGGKWNYGFH
jgi:hypothetical protein